ncbi:hypothetical protein M8J76_011757 [Diaphorina citri]|nr:hypothetical protein M8J76_011757 [Diaphorina citri]
MWEAQDSQEDAGSSVLTESSSSILTEDIPVAEYRCDVMRLLSWFVDGQDGKIKPSEYRSELGLSLKERYDRLVDLSKRKPMPLNEYTTSSTFSVLPSALVFQNFVPAQTYKVNVRITNLLHTTQSLVISSFPSPQSVFKISYDSKLRSLKVAPGMTLTLKLEFCPTHSSDVGTHVELKSNSETFHIPIIALGPRPELDIPDGVVLPRSAPKRMTGQVVLMKNIGRVEAAFMLSTKKPFSVTPAKAFLRPDEVVEVWVKCMSLQTGSFETDLQVRFETGELLTADIKCECSNLRLELSTSCVDFGQVYMGLNCTQTVQIVNNSDHPVQYCWVKYADLNGDLAEIENVANITVSFHPASRDAFNLVAYCDVTGFDTRQTLNIQGQGVGPKFALSATKVSLDLFVCSTETFEIFITNVGDIPGYVHFREQRLVFGGQICCCPDYIELKPGSYQAFSLQYRSPCVGEFTEEICFHIVESEETLKFILSGRVRSVSLEFCSPLIDFGNVSFGFPVSRTLEFHSNSPDPVSFLIRVDGDGRESPLTYEDYLSAPYQEMSAPPCPREFLVEPERGVVQPGCSARIKITLTCNRLRRFSSLLRFELLALKSQSAAVPIQYECQPSYITCDPKVTLYDLAFIQHEYSYEITLSPECTQSAAFQYIPHQVTVYDLAFIQYEYSYKITLSPECTQSAAFQYIPHQVTVYDLAFIQHKYSYEITLSPECTQSAVFQYIPYQESNDKMQVCLSVDRGVVSPGSPQTIQVTFMANEVGPIEYPLRFHTLGVESADHYSMLEVTGCGPLVFTSTEVIDWGDIPLLRVQNRTLQIRNESLIPAHFCADFEKKNNLWTVSPERGIVSPNSSLDLTLSVNLMNAGPVTSAMHIHVKHSEKLKVKLMASGIGYSIRTEPSIISQYDFGKYVV